MRMGRFTWMMLVGVSFSLVWFAAPAMACGCAGEPYSPWRAYLFAPVPLVVAGVAGWLGWKALSFKRSIGPGQ